MEDIIQFKKITEENKEMVGMKAFNLSRLREFCNVPNGFVLSRNVMQKFLEENNLNEPIQRFLSSLMIDNENIIPIVNMIQKKIINSKIPDDLKEEITEFYESIGYSRYEEAGAMLDKKKESLVSVRNGEWTQDSENIYQLNIIGKEKLIEAIKLAFASNFTSKKVIEKKEQGKDTNQIFENSINPVIIQSMQQVQRSGMSLSLNPNTNSEKEVLIRASFGLGMAKDDPNLEYDEYLLDQDYEIKSNKIGKQDYAYEKDIDSDITVKYMLKENSTKEKVNNYHLKEIGKITKKIARILESSIMLEWGFNKDKLIVFDAKMIEIDKINHEIDEYENKKEEDKIIEDEVSLEEYDLDKENFKETDNETVETVEFFEETKNIEPIDMDQEITIISETQDNLESGPKKNDEVEIIDLEDELETPTIDVDEQKEEVVTLDDFESDDEKNDSDFAYNFIEEKPSEKKEVIIEDDKIILDFGESKEEKSDESEPDLFIHMNRPNVHQAAKKMAESFEIDDEINLEKTDDNFAQNLLDEDFEDTDDELMIEDSVQEEKKIESMDKEEKKEDEPSFFDMIEEESENLFDNQDNNEEKVEKNIDVLQPPIESLEEISINTKEIDQEERQPEGDGDFFSRMEVEEDGDFIFSQDSESEKEEPKPIESVDKNDFIKEDMKTKPTAIMEKDLGEASNVVLTSDATILNSLKKKYKELFNKEPHNYFNELINELNTKVDVPYENEIRKVRQLREKYLADYEALPNEDIAFCIDTSKKFTNEF